MHKLTSYSVVASTAPHSELRDPRANEQVLS
jgi:hypothetical protein